MNTEISIKSIKGKQEITLSISPSNPLETALFKELFSNGNFQYTSVPNKDTIMFIKKDDEQSTIPTVKAEE